ncbi:MAG: class I SAM-dependent methyltransferase [Bacteroidetes bacterium]|nr:class I SAM-dependent methyltransferase [Bacteroidota bacterium]
MSFSNEWDEKYRENTHMSIWPWSDLVSYIMRYSRPKEPNKCNLLELGCGAGANIEFFKWLGVNYFALEGSLTMVKMLCEKFSDFSKTIKVADFTKQIPFNENFDIVVDRASLTHNDTQSIRRTLSLIKDYMKPGASFVGIDWFSTNHSDFIKGNHLEDGFTCSNFTSGQFAGVGNVHFSNKEHILDLFEDFEVKILEEKVVSKSIPNDSHIFASWNIYAVKK